MIRDLGIVKPGTTLRIPFSSFDKDDGSSITMTNYAVADILIYKDGSTTERASTAGFTATTDFDAKTGKHVLIIDLADNTTADFFANGSEYLVGIDAVTVDAVTTGGWIARFCIGYRGAILDTTIATLASQTSFTLATGPAEDDALNNLWVVIHDAASAVQFGWGIVSDYTGSTKTVTLAAGTTFTVAAKDNISIMGPSPLLPTVAGRTLDVSTGGEAGVDWANVGSPTTSNALTGTTIATTQKVDIETIKTNPVVNAGTVTFPTTATLASTTNITAGTITTATNVTTVNALAAGVITAASIASDAITDAKVASDVTIASVTGAVGSVTGNVGGNVTGTVGGFTTAAKAELQTEAEDALVAHRLDELLNADSDIDGAAPPTVGSVFHELMSKTAGSFTFDQTTDSNEALRDRGDAAWTTITAAAVRTAVGMSAADLDTQLDAIVGQTTDIQADTNELQTDWASGGTLRTILQARATQTSVDTIDDLLDTEMPALTTAVDNLPTNAELATAITTGLTAALTEGYRSTGATGSVRDLLYEILANITEFSISGTTKTAKKLDGSTTAKTYTLDSSTTPTSITETT